MSYFTFTPENISNVDKVLQKYPKDRFASAIMPVLMIAQKQNNNYLSVDVMDSVAEYLGVPPMKVYEVASFYTMYNTSPVGKYHIQVCRNISCWLRGYDEILKSLESATNTTMDNTSKDDLFTISGAECLGACANAPVMQINDEYYEDLTTSDIASIITDLKNGVPVKRFSAKHRSPGESN